MNFRELYVNGKKAIRSRSTEVGQYDTIVTTNPYNVGDSNPEGGPYIVLKADEVAGLDGDKGDQELFLNNSWTGNVLRIKEIVNDTVEGRVRVYLQEPEFTIIFNRPHPWVGNYRGSGHVTHAYLLENAYELIDLENEWYLDTAKNTLYFKAPAGMTMSETEVVAPQVETLVEVNGGSLDTPVTGLTFQGLSFQHSTWLVPREEGLVDGQSLQYMWSANKSNEIYVRRSAAAFYVACADHIRVENNEFTNLVAVALDFEYGTHDDVIKNNTIENIGGNGIQIGKFTQDENTEYHVAYNPADPREICTNELVINNTVQYIGQQYVSSVAIIAGYPRNITIANNTIAHAPYSAISVGYGWTATPNAMSGNKILRNDIGWFSQVTDDSGAIYTLSNQGSGSLMAENYVHDYTKNQWAEYPANGFYLDEQTMGYTVVNNVLANTANIGADYVQRGSNTYLGDFLRVNVSENEDANAIAVASGVQDYLRTTDTLKPVLYRSTLTGNRVTLEGYFPLEETPNVVFTGGSGELKVTELLEHTENTVKCFLPEGAVAGPVSGRSGVC